MVEKIEEMREFKYKVIKQKSQVLTFVFGRMCCVKKPWKWDLK